MLAHRLRRWPSIDPTLDQRLVAGLESSMRFLLPCVTVLNISTSAQLAFQMHQSFTPPHLDQTSSIEYFPYFHRRYLAVAASLTGGNVMASLVRMIQQWTHEFGKLYSINLNVVPGI